MTCLVLYHALYHALNYLYQHSSFGLVLIQVIQGVIQGVIQNKTCDKIYIYLYHNTLRSLYICISVYLYVISLVNKQIHVTLPCKYLINLRHKYLINLRHKLIPAL